MCERIPGKGAKGRARWEVYLAVRPMLAVSSGALWMLSTPNGKRGFFYEAWERGGAGWKRIRATVYDCPRIGRDFLEEERRATTETSFRQEYLCEFVHGGRAVFGRDRMEDVDISLALIHR